MSLSQLIAPVPAIPKPADRCCDSDPYFRARLEAITGTQQILANTDVCAIHLGDAVQNLTTWAQQTNVRGQVIVLAIGGPDPGRLAGTAGSGERQMPTSFAFSVIPIDPLATNSAPGYRRKPTVRPAPSGYRPSRFAPAAHAWLSAGGAA